ncbi:MAG: hypothetical protein ACFFAO_08185 [Candidatus Hermodarchaeota archaeon]
MIIQEQISYGEFLTQIYGFSFVMIAAIVILIAGWNVWFKNKGWTFIGFGFSGLIIRSIGTIFLTLSFDNTEFYALGLTLHITGVLIFCSGLIIGFSYLYLEVKNLEKKEVNLKNG